MHNLTAPDRAKAFELPVRAQRPPRTVAVLSAGDRFEDFYDKIGVSLDTFRDEFTGGWLFNYVRALSLVDVRTVLLFTSARVQGTVNFRHGDSGASVWVLPCPRLHQKSRNAQRRLFPNSDLLAAMASYAATPLRALTRALREERCDAMLCQEYEHPRFDTLVILGRLIGLPVFATYQGANKTTTRLERPLRQVTVRRCAGLVIPSRDEIARVQRTYRVTSEKIAAIPNPVEIVASTTQRHAIRNELGIASTTRVVAWHGRVQIDKKGLDTLLGAWDRICSERPDADTLLLLIGTGGNADVLRRRLGSSRRVLWIDRYVFSRRELWSYLSAADLYAIPSRREGFAVAVLEAMACGLPVVASDVSGVADALPAGEADGGIIVPSGDAIALAAAILRLIDHPELARRLGEAGRQRVQTEFSLQVIGPRLREFFFPEHSRHSAESADWLGKSGPVTAHEFV